MRRILILHRRADAPADLVPACKRWCADLGVGCTITDRLAGGEAPGDDTLGIVTDAELEVHVAGIPVVEVESASGAGVYRVHGRGIDSYRWAIRHLVERAAWPFITRAYGDDPNQVGDLRLPEAPGLHPTVALLHGGFWREQWTRDLMDALAVDLVRRGYATWNLEYRRVGASGGGWPTTFDDVAAGVRAVQDLAAEHPLDPGRTAIIGHSAGGQLALWAAAELRPALVVSLAGVCDLVAAANAKLGDGAVDQFLGAGPGQEPGRYAHASPAERLPLGVRQLLVHGTADDRVPAWQSEDYAKRADHAELLTLDGIDHFSLIEPRSPAWRSVADRLSMLLPHTRGSPRS